MKNEIFILLNTYMGSYFLKQCRFDQVFSPQVFFSGYCHFISSCSGTYGQKEDLYSEPLTPSEVACCAALILLVNKVDQWIYKHFSTPVITPFVRNVTLTMAIWAFFSQAENKFKIFEYSPLLAHIASAYFIAKVSQGIFFSLLGQIRSKE